MSIPGEDGYETPDDGTPSTTPALDYMLEEGCHTDVIDILCEMLVKRGMTRDEVDAALNEACGQWLEDDTEKWWEL